jgi:SAM-dependent methyltransferase
LPKRVILRSFGGYGSWGRERLSDILNALRAVQGQPLIEHQALQAFIDCDQEESDSPEQGLSLRRFKNGNAHLIFDADTLLIINRALAEYYGDVLPDVDGDEAAPQQSREVAKDLQFYPTPDKVAERVVGDLHFPKSCRVLEPSCGDGQLLHHIPRHVEHLGIEVHAERAAKARSYGYSVLTANFLDVPEPRTEAEQFDRVVMNPPFYGRHYLRHIRHAMRFLKPGGTLTAILPATAQYDHGELPEANDFYNAWEDLPAGSFAESGTRVPTGVFTWRKPR